MESFRGSKIVLMLEDSLIIIQRDNKPGLAYANMWDLPGGGREGDETAFECVAREVKEELGIIIDFEKLLWKKRYESKQDSGTSSYFFVATITQNEINSIQFGNEGQGWDLVTVDEFLVREDIVPFFQERMRDYLKHKNISSIH